MLRISIVAILALSGASAFAQPVPRASTNPWPGVFGLAVGQPIDPARMQTLGFVSEDRRHEGLMLGLDVADNMAITALGAFQRGGFLDRRRIQAMARRSIEALGIRPPGLRHLA